MNSCFEINPKDYPKDKTYLCLISLMATLTLSFTVVALSKQIWILAAFGGALLLLALYTISQRNRGEILEFREKSLIISRTKPEKILLKLHQTTPLELSIEYVKNFTGDGEIESIATLNLWDFESGIRRRTKLGLFLSRKSKIRVSEDLRDFFTQHQWPVSYKNRVN